MRKRMKSVNEVYQEQLHNSDCEVISAVNFLQIVFHGSLARIPSLKNSKIPGRNFISNDTQGKLRAMTTLFEFRARNLKPTFNRDVELYVQVIIASGSRLDEDNGFAAIKDWLEPKKTRNRGWGIGITDNDKLITGEARHGWRIGLEIPQTIITIRRYSDVQKLVTEFDYKIGMLDIYGKNIPLKHEENSLLLHRASPHPTP